MPKILASDIGGTSSRFAVFESETASVDDLRLGESVWLKTADADSFPALINLLRESDLPLAPEEADIFSLAVAGPIEEGTFCDPPNIPWQIDLRNAQAEVGFSSFVLINDFLAQAYACLSPLRSEADLILEGSGSTTGTIAVIGAGTGLGKAFLVPDGRGGYRGGASEGGHAVFGSENEADLQFGLFVAEKNDKPYPVWDDIVSGRGWSALHEFLTGEELSAKDISDAHPADTFRAMSRLYAMVVRNFALETLAMGGVFVAGGVAAKNPELLTHESFRSTFHNSPSHSHILENIPLYLMDEEESGLWGAAVAGIQELRARKDSNLA